MKGLLLMFITTSTIRKAQNRRARKIGASKEKVTNATG